MSDLGGSSFYDTLNKLVIGFLLLLPFVKCFYPSLHLDKAICLFTFSVVCWVIGLFFWVPIEYISNNFPRRISLYKNNNIKWIRDSYLEVYTEINTGSHNLNLPKPNNLEKKDYYIIYFTLQKQNLLGCVPYLEIYSAFFRNLSIVAILWALVILPTLWHLYKDSYTHAEIALTITASIFVGILGPICRYYTEKKIFRSIFEAYFLGYLNTIKVN